MSMEAFKATWNEAEQAKLDYNTRKVALCNEYAGELEALWRAKFPKRKPIDLSHMADMEMWCKMDDKARDKHNADMKRLNKALPDESKAAVAETFKARAGAMIKAEFDLVDRYNERLTGAAEDTPFPPAENASRAAWD